MSKKCKDKCNKKCKKKTSIGGQALLEGIMMRGPKVSAMAVRDPDGEMVIETWDTGAPSKSWIGKTPIIRGVYNFAQSMISGYKCLMRSAEISTLDEVEEEMKKEKEAKRIKKEAKRQGISEEELIAKEAAEKEAAEKAAAEMARAITAEGITEAVTGAATVASAEGEKVQGGDEAQADGETKSATDISAEDKSQKKNSKDKKEKKESSALINGIMVIAVILAIALSIVLFIFLPAQIYKWFTPILPHSITGNVVLNTLVKSCFEGILKILLLVLYMFCVSFMKDIRRTFMYHGAEHKTIFCYEHDEELTVENVRKQKREHPRCGTSFLILMLLVGIFVSFFIDPLFLAISGDSLIFDSGLYIALRTVIKILLIPLIMGIGYELIKFAGRHDNIVTRIISAPGMWLQHLTVKEPTDDMIECAIAAFVEVIPEEEKAEMAAKKAAEAEETKPEVTENEADGSASDAKEE